MVGFDVWVKFAEAPYSLFHYNYAFTCFFVGVGSAVTSPWRSLPSTFPENTFPQAQPTFSVDIVSIDQSEGQAPISDLSVRLSVSRFYCFCFALQVDLGDKRSLYDTPGLLLPHTLTSRLTAEELRAAIPKKTVRVEHRKTLHFHCVSSSSLCSIFRENPGLPPIGGSTLRLSFALCSAVLPWTQGFENRHCCVCGLAALVRVRVRVRQMLPLLVLMLVLVLLLC